MSANQKRKTTRRNAQTTVGATKPGFVGMIEPDLWTGRPSAVAGHMRSIGTGGASRRIDGGTPVIYTSKGNDWTARFEPIAVAVAKLPARNLIFDGAAGAPRCRGPDFHGLRRHADAGRIVYKAFDLLWLDGQDLRPLAWAERKRRLQALSSGGRKAPVISYVEAVHDDGQTVYANACELHLEGIVGKRVDSPYRAGRSAAWLKCRCAIVETMAVVGFSTTRNQIDGLYLAGAEDGRLVHACKVENGLIATAMKQLEARLRPLVGKPYYPNSKPRTVGAFFLPTADPRTLCRNCHKKTLISWWKIRDCTLSPLRKVSQ